MDINNYNINNYLGPLPSFSTGVIYPLFEINANSGAVPYVVLVDPQVKDRMETARAWFADALNELVKPRLIEPDSVVRLTTGQRPVAVPVANEFSEPDAL